MPRASEEPMVVWAQSCSRSLRGASGARGKETFWDDLPERTQHVHREAHGSGLPCHGADSCPPLRLFLPCPLLSSKPCTPPQPHPLCSLLHERVHQLLLVLAGHGVRLLQLAGVQQHLGGWANTAMGSGEGSRGLGHCAACICRLCGAVATQMNKPPTVSYARCPPPRA